ncbi:hypothetical protein PBCVNEJV1_146L [Paramecium bursaria Chlorella virus NE-JV-1]|nr:hypothetical protein PBCVNEJV1_146L [Paramecium bursaria Chlorella virus NE-JV-1]
MSDSTGLVVISQECTNCMRLLETLKRIPKHGLLIVEYSSLTPMQRVGLTAVPTLIQNDGKRIVGTAVFEYINSKYYQSMTIEGANVFDSDELAFSNVGDPVGQADQDSSYAFLS